jgi:hypothetical protein
MQRQENSRTFRILKKHAGDVSHRNYVIQLLFAKKGDE